jgi:hypothetical protein
MNWLAWASLIVGLAALIGIFVIDRNYRARDIAERDEHEQGGI